jgi:HNH endonuclease
MAQNRLWSRNETVLALDLYCRVPFGRCDRKTSEVIALAEQLGRTPSAVAMKLVNLASLDPQHQHRGVVGLTHGSKMDREVWETAHADWDGFLDETIASKSMISPMVDEQPVETVVPLDETVPHDTAGATRETTVHARVGQSFFREMILAGYRNRCCVTGIDNPELLVASHIVPWADDAANRLNPRNGLCLSAIYDRAFDRGLLTITPDYEMHFAPRLVERFHAAPYDHFFGRYHGTRIELPERWHPDSTFLMRHNATSGLV